MDNSDVGTVSPCIADVISLVLITWLQEPQCTGNNHCFSWFQNQLSSANFYRPKPHLVDEHLD